MKQLLGINISDEEFDFLFDQQAMGRTLMVKDGKIIAVMTKPSQKQLYENRIAELELLLSNTDYQAIKYFEKLISEENYAGIKARRQECRDEINTLKAKINALGEEEPDLSDYVEYTPTDNNAKTGV